MKKGTLFVVATPIGNLDDLSPRAMEVLRMADLVAAEDTRVTGRLLSHFGIKGRQLALHEHNESSQIGRIVNDLKSGKSVALVSDAGTPLISDPGYKLLEACHLSGISVSPVAGPSALIAALSVSGLPTDRFVYEGFLPAKRAARVSRLSTLASESRTIVLLESVHRIGDTVADLIDVFGPERRAFIGRELTKIYEQCVLAGLASLLDMLADDRIPAKGEFVIVVAGATKQETSDTAIAAAAMLGELIAVLPGKQAVEIVARLSGESRNALYQKMLNLKAEKS